MVYLNQLFIDGETKEDSYTPQLQAGGESTTKRRASTPRQIRKKRGAIAESAPQSSETISSDRQSFAELDFLNTESSATLDQDSTTKGRVLKSWWTSQKEEISRNLWLPTETDSPAFHLNSSHGSSQSMGLKSWFSTRQWTKPVNQSCARASSLSSRSFYVDSMAEDDIKVEDKGLRSRTVKLKPTPQQKSSLRKLFGDYRVTYNMALDGIKNRGMRLNKLKLRDTFVTAKNIPPEKAYLLETHKDIRAGAVFDLYAACKGNLTKKKNSAHTFEIKFKSRKTTTSIPIPKTTLKIEGKKISMCPKTMKLRIRFVDHGSIRLTEISHDCRLSLDSVGDYHLHIPISKHCILIENQDESICALDPGVRTFQTLYDPCNGAVKFGCGDIRRIYKLCRVIDSLHSKYDISKGTKRKRSFKKAMHRVIRLIRRLRDEMHWQFINYIVKNYKRIILPLLETSRMVMKTDRNINSKTARNMQNWSHGLFRQRLIYKASLHGTQVYIRDEIYTSKTCCRCGTIHARLGSSKIFDCPACGTRCDRDIGAALNILSKHVRLDLSETN